MAEDDSPTVARLRVRIAVREAREATGLTQAQVAEEMEWSLSKVIRIENGEVTISTNDLRSLLAVLGCRDPQEIRSFGIICVPGPLQTPEYAAALTGMRVGALHRLTGGAAVFAGQLASLLDLVESKLLKLRTIPCDIPVRITDSGRFDLVTPAEGDTEVMYRENGMGDEIVENRAATGRHRKRFDQLWRVAMNETDTIDFIRQRTEVLTATPTRGDIT